METQPTVNWIRVMIITGIALIAAGVAYFIGSNYSIPESASTVTLTTPSATSTATDVTANWKMYTSDTYGFSFKYPSGWVLDKSNPKSVSLNSPENEKLLKEIESTPPGYSDAYRSDFIFYYYEDLSAVSAANGTDSKKYKTISDYVNDKSYFSDLKEITFAGQKAYEVTEGGMGPSDEIIIQMNEHIYKISFGYSDIKTKTTEDNRILSTFQFTK